LNLKTHRLVRQLHLWIGAWGAIAAILFGISGFIQNHRGIMKLPQGDTTEISSVELEVPESARESREAMRNWLRDTQHIDVEIQRARGGKRWMFNGGNARILTQVEYVEGASTATVHKSESSPLAILSRLHKGVGGGIPWILLSDSFSVAMVLLGISGIILWARGRTLAQMAFSIVSVAVVVLLAIGGSAIV
jgi:hypothetical protein